MNTKEEMIDDNSRDTGHVPVMPDEVVGLLAPHAGQVILDCTVGRGGHASELIKLISPGGRYVGLDVDEENLAFTRERLDEEVGECECQVDLVHGNFGDAEQLLGRLELSKVDLLLADLGFSSNQMNDPQRGLSFMADGPLDMRFDGGSGYSAAELIGCMEESELADLIWRYGEERLSRRIARKIVAGRVSEPIETTRQLADLCVSAYGRRGGRYRIHPATRTFMALRIAVNDELGRLVELLGQIVRIMALNGRAVIISFHSLEDRLVKRAFRELVNRELGRGLTKKPLRASPEEQAANRRSRSAKLRAIEITGTCAT